MTPEEVKLFEAPDLTALQRNWPRIALRASLLVVVPTLVVWLARTLDLYRTLTALPLPLDFLRAGPFAYEGKLIFTLVAVLLGVALLVPKRTTTLVVAVTLLAIGWVGHPFIQLQWARLFTPDFAFRRDAMPGPVPWMLGAALLLAVVVYLLLENLLETREQQGGRGLAPEETRALLDVGARALAGMLAVGVGIAVTLVLVYVGLRALLADSRLPFHLNPVFVLLSLGVALAVLVGLAARNRSPVDDAP